MGAELCAAQIDYYQLTKLRDDMGAPPFQSEQHVEVPFGLARAADSRAGGGQVRLRRPGLPSWDT